jgi:hypothetical protein
MSINESLPVIAPLIRALGFLQMIEEGLRVYVGTAEELIAAAVPYGVPFRVDRSALEAAAMGKLINMFTKVNRNEELLARLRQLTKHRNYIAHEAFRRTIQGASNGKEDLEYMKGHAKAVGDEAEQILGILGQEMKSLLVNYPNSKASQAWNLPEGGFA